jgi:transportin-3
MSVFSAIVKLVSSYHLAVAHEDIEKSHNFCRLFTELAESFLLRIVR